MRGWAVPGWIVLAGVWKSTNPSGHVVDLVLGCKVCRASHEE